MPVRMNVVRYASKQRGRCFPTMNPLHPWCAVPPLPPVLVYNPAARKSGGIPSSQSTTTYPTANLYGGNWLYYLVEYGI